MKRAPRPSSAKRVLALSSGVLLAIALQSRDIITPPSFEPLLLWVEDLEARLPNRPPREEPIEFPEPLENATTALWPLLGGFVFLLLFGPKYTHAKFRRRKDAAMFYGNVGLNRNGASRGHFATGKTGSGKTQVILNPILHSRFINECGRERKTWQTSATALAIAQAKTLFREYAADQFSKVSDLHDELLKLDDQIVTAKDSAQSLALRDYIEKLELQKKLRISGNRVFKAKNEKGQDVATIGYSDKELAERVAAARAGKPLPNEPKPIELRTLGPEAIKLAELEEHYLEIKTKIDKIHYNVHLRRIELQKYTDAAKPLQYDAYPWGGCCFDEKGLFWQTLVPMATYYGREDDLMLLQTRPDWAGTFWQPPAKFNVLSDEAVDSDTYAKLIVDTAMAVEGSDSKDPFFPTQAQIQIGWAIKLMRAARTGQIEQLPDQDPLDRTYPSLTKILEILTVRKDFDRYLSDIGAVGRKMKKQELDDNGSITESEEIGQPLIRSSTLDEAIHRLTNDYWAQPEEQRGGVSSTIYNYLIPFAQPDVAEVFCSENTFDLNAINQGKIVCLAMPQKLAVQRRYIVTLAKQLFYSIVERRFDGDLESPVWVNKNYLVADQDEAQSFAIRRDGAVDKTREANGTTLMLTQTHMAIYQALGGKEKGFVILSNLANRYICGAALEECAEESAKIIGKEKVFKRSKTYSRNGNSTSESEEERYIVPPLKIKGLADFHVYFVPSEGKWLYKLFLVQPVTPDGRIPKWWFGTYDPIQCFKAITGKSTEIPFWRSKAPIKMHARHILGLDTTFIQLEARSRKKGN